MTYLLIFSRLSLIPVCAVMNRARGTRFWSHLPGTEAGRLLATFVMAALVALAAQSLDLVPLIWAGLMLWCSPGWDEFWSAEIGDSVHSKLWGCCMMFLRELYILPTFAVLALFCGGNYTWSAIAGLLWLPYLAFGLGNHGYAIARSEYVVGALIGLAFYGILFL